MLPTHYKHLRFVLFILSCLFSFKSIAHHIVTGNLSYVTTSANSVELNLKMIIEEGQGPDFDSEITLQVFHKPFGADSFVYQHTIATIMPSITDTILFNENFRIPIKSHQGSYQFEYDEFLNDGDYLFVYQRCCRTNDFNNIINSDSVGSSFILQIPFENGAIIQNASPTLLDKNVLKYANNGENFNFSLPISESDGDSLAFRLHGVLDGAGLSVISDLDCDGVTPYGPCPPPYPFVPYGNGYLAENPIGNDGIFELNEVTGQVTGKIDKAGKYAYGIQILEYRDGHFIGESFLDLNIHIISLSDDCLVNMVLQTQEEVDSLGRSGCRVLMESLTVKGSEIKTLAPLNSIDSIYGHLVLDGLVNCTDFGAFMTMKHLGGNLEIKDSPISNLTNFSALTKIGGGLFLSHNPNLTSFDGLPSQNSYKAISIIATPISDFSFFSSVDSIRIFLNIVFIKDIGPLKNFEFTNLKYVGNLLNLSQLSLGNKSIFPSLHYCGHIVFEGIDGLIHFDDFNALDSIAFSAKISGNSDLETIKGFKNLNGSPFSLQIRYNNKLQSVQLPNLPNNSSLEIANNALLPILDLASNTVENLTNLKISENSSLQTINGPKNLQKIRQNFWITANPLLKSILGFKEVLEIGDNFDISDNTNLEELEGFYILNYVGKKLYVRNTSLETCTNFCNLFSNGFVSYIVINNNKGTCSGNSSCVSNISYNVFYDENGNGIQDGSGDFTFYGTKEHLITTTPAPLGYNVNLQHFFKVYPGTFNFIPQEPNLWEITNNPEPVVITGYGESASTTIGIHPIGSVTRFETSTVLETTPRCDRENTAFFTFKNTGNQYFSGLCAIALDGNYTYDLTNQSNFTALGDSIIFTIEDLRPGSTFEIKLDVKFLSPDFVGQEVYFNSYVFDNDGKEISSFLLNRVLTCSFDPNDKVTHPDRTGDINYTLFGETLFYTIHFENIGNAEAENVRVVDKLASSLDLSTFRLASSSHSPMDIRLNDSTGTLTFIFENINLAPGVDLQGNPIETNDNKGFVSFWIKPKSGLDELTRILNQAEIYFDANEPIITNKVVNTLVSELPIDGSQPAFYGDELSVFSFPNPTRDFITFWSFEEIKNAEITIFDLNGRQVIQQHSEITFIGNNFDIQYLQAGVYFVIVKNPENGKQTQLKIVKSY